MRVRFQKVPGSYLTLVCAVGLGAFVRLLPVVLREFPLNDGGLFFRMTQDLVASGFRPPLMTTYNGGTIPFGYPPLGFYLLGGLHLATGVPMIELMRWLPALFSVLTIPAVYVLSRHLLQRTDVAAMATLVFALIPRSHEWILMGGGIARAPGMLLAILALLQTARLAERPTWIRAALLGLLLGLVTLSHLEMAWFTVFSLLLLTAFRGRTAPVLARVAAALGLGALISGIWWIPFIARHGIAPFLQAASSGQHTSTSTAEILTNLTGEPFQGVFLVLAVLGVILCLLRRDFLLPTWLALIILLDPRAAGTDASIPLGMLVAVTVVLMILPSLATAGVRGPAAALPSSGQQPPGASHLWHSLALAALAGYGVLAAVSAPFFPGSPVLVSLRPGEMEAAEWINANVPSGSRFLVLSGRSAWGADPLSEWLPALTNQVSLATPQGREWVGGLVEAAARHRTLQLCAERGRECLGSWLETGEVEFDYFLVARYPPGSAIQTVALEEGLVQSNDYTIVHSNAEAVIFSHAAEP